MGLFSSKKKTVVNGDIYPLVEEKDRTPFNKRGLYNYIFSKNNESLYQHMLDEYERGLPVRFNHAYRVAARPSYSIGLPASTLTTDMGAITNAIEDHLIALEGSPVSVQYIITSEPHLGHYAWVKLQEQYGYNLNTNELEFLSTSLGYPVYLDRFEVTVGTNTQEEVVDPSYLEPKGMASNWGAVDTRPEDLTRPLEAFVLGSEALDSTTVHYIGVEVVQPPTPEPEEGEEPVVPDPITVLHPGSLVLTYEDVIFPPPEDGMPFEAEGEEVQVMYTVGGVRKTYEYSIGSGEDPVLEASFLGTRSTSDYYPALYARVNGVDLYTLDKTDPKYKDLRKLGKALGVDWAKWGEDLFNNMEEPDKVKEALIMVCIPLDSETQTCLKYMWALIQTLVEEGTPEGPVDSQWLGVYPESTGVTSSTRYIVPKVLIADTIYAYTFSCSAVAKVEHTGVKCPVGTYTFTKVIERYSYCYQETENTFIEYFIDHPITSFDINGHTSNELVVPLRRSVTKGMFKSTQLEQLFFETAHVFIGTSVVVKTKWYQRGAFKAVLSLVGVVVSIALGPAGFAAFATWQSALVSIAIGLSTGLATSLAMSLMSKILVKIGVSGDLMQIAAIAILAVAAYSGITGNNVGGMTAVELLGHTNNALAMSQQMVQLQMQDLQKSLLAMQADFATKLEEINNLQDSLGLLSSEALLEISSSFFESRLGESVESFHYRTIHMDVVQVSHDQINRYVELTTRLPEFHELVNMMQRKTV